MTQGNYGSFVDDGYEYSVKTPHTPRDWFNFFWNPTYLACAGQNMNGFSLHQNDAGVVAHLFGKQDMREDPRWIYVRDNATGEVWSAGYFPCLTEQDEFECRHGLGYTVLRTLQHGIRALALVRQLAIWRGEPGVARQCASRYSELSEAIWKHRWDDDHFIYAINDDGERIGSNASSEGKYFINPQSWSLLSGVVDADTYTEIAERLEPLMDSPVGPVHNWPPFTEYDPGIGQLSGTPPGFFTNGNVYCHAASFKIAADFEAGRNDKAFETLKRILPSAEKSEPFAQANGYVGPTAQRMTRHVSDDPWRTGTVAWTFLNSIDRMLGFRRTLEGFHLDPRLPSTWNEVRATRPFRGKNYEIHFRRGSNPRIEVDGKLLVGDLILAPKGDSHKPTVCIYCETADAPVEKDPGTRISASRGQTPMQKAYARSL